MLTAEARDVCFFTLIGIPRNAGSQPTSIPRWTSRVSFRVENLLFAGCLASIAGIRSPNPISSSRRELQRTNNEIYGIKVHEQNRIALLSFCERGSFMPTPSPDL